MTTNVKGKALATGVKGKTKASGAKGKTKATGLKEFLSNLAIDPRKLGEFLHEPEAAMSAANVSEGDKTALRSGVAGMVAARLAGVPLDQAFQPPSQLMAQVTPPPPYVAHIPPPPYVAHIPPPPYVAQAMPPPPYVAQATLPPAYVAQATLPPAYVAQATLPPAYPPQFVVYPPPQFVVQSPPYYPR